MAVSVFKTFVAGEILTASDLNSSFLKVFDNGEALGWPATTGKDFAGNTLTLDAGDGTTLKASTDNLIDIGLAGTLLWQFDGTVASPVNGIKFTAAAAASEPALTAFGSDTDISINLVPKGAGLVTSAGTEILLAGSAQAILSAQVFS